MNKVMHLGFLIFFMTFSLFGVSQIYKWTDENGKTHFSDKPPEHGNAETIDQQLLAAQTSSYTHVAVKELTTLPLANKRNSKIVMYTTSRCGYCAKARSYFAKHKISFKEKNIDTSKKYHGEFKKFGGKGVPVLFWGKFKMTGFSVARFEKMYKKVT